MEEKERYEYFFGTNTIKDNKTNQFYDCVVDLLNQQDKQIKELEEENNFLEKRNEELIIDRRDICLERNDIFEENQQLKEQLSNEEQSHDLCIKSFEEETEKLRKQIKFESDARERFKRENQQLKQSLKEIMKNE